MARARAGWAGWFDMNRPAFILVRARLLNVDLVPPAHAIGQSTTEALQSGMVLGYLGLIEGLITRISSELEGDPTVIITGGYSEIFAAASDLIDAYEPDLTVEGLRQVYLLNR